MNAPTGQRRLRLHRQSIAGQLYMLTLVTHGRKPLFFDWPSARPVVGALRRAQALGECDTLAWVLMPDHLHWLVLLHRGPLHEIVRKLKSRVHLGWPEPKPSALWQRGFHDRAIRQLQVAVVMARYIVANPLRAGLVPAVGLYCLWDSIWLGDPDGIFQRCKGYVI